MLPLQQALDVLADDPPRALQFLITAWQQQPHPQLAELVERLSVHVESSDAQRLRDSPDAKIPQTSGDGVAWQPVAAQGALADHGALLDVIERASKDDWGARISVISGWERDPRVSGCLHRMIASPPFRSTSSKPIWNQLFSALLKLRDPRTLPALQKRLEVPIPAGRTMQKWFARTLPRHIATIEGDPPTLAPLTPQQHDLLIRITEAVHARYGAPERPPTLEELLGEPRPSRPAPPIPAATRSLPFSFLFINQFDFSDDGALLVVKMATGEPAGWFTERKEETYTLPQALMVYTRAGDFQRLLHMPDLSWYTERGKRYRFDAQRKLIFFHADDRVQVICAQTGEVLWSLEADVGREERFTAMPDLTPDGLHLFTERRKRVTCVTCHSRPGADAPALPLDAEGTAPFLPRCSPCGMFFLTSSYGARVYAVARSGFSQAGEDLGSVWRADSMLVGEVRQALHVVDPLTGWTDIVPLPVPPTSSGRRNIGSLLRQGCDIVCLYHQSDAGKMHWMVSRLGADNQLHTRSWTLRWQDARCGTAEPLTKTLVTADHTGTLRWWAEGSNTTRSVQTLSSPYVEGIQVDRTHQVMWLGPGLEVSAGGTRVGTLMEKKPITAVALGAHLYVAAGRKISRFTVEAQKRASIGSHLYTVRALSLSGTGTLASGGDDQLVRLWGLDGEKKGEHAGHGCAVSHLSHHHSGQLLASADTAGVVLLWQEASAKALAELTLSAPIRGLGWGADGQHLVVAAGETLHRWWPASGHTTQQDLPAAITCIALDPCTDRVAIGLDNRQLWVSQGASLQQHPCPLQHPLFAMAFSAHDGRLLLGAGPHGSGHAVTICEDKHP